MHGKYFGKYTCICRVRQHGIRKKKDQKGKPSKIWESSRLLVRELTQLSPRYLGLKLKQWEVHRDNGIWFSTKNKWALRSWKYLEEPKMHIAKWKKPTWEGYILCDSDCMKVCKTVETKKSGVARGRRTWVGRAERMFRAVKILCIIAEWWIPVYARVHLSKPVECAALRGDPKVDCGVGWLWCVIVVHPW